MMLNLIGTSLLHILITTTVLAYSENSVYQPQKTRGEQLFMNSRSLDPERSTRRIFNANPIRFGGRSDIPPLVGKEYDNVIDEEMDRERRAFKEDVEHMRFGRASTNFMRFGKKNLYNSRIARAGNNFLRFGRGSSDFLRFGRTGQYLHNKGEVPIEDKRSSNFIRFGKRFEEDENTEDIPEDAEQIIDQKLQKKRFHSIICPNCMVD